MSTDGRARQGFQGLKLPGHGGQKTFPLKHIPMTVVGRLENCLGELTFG